MTTATTRKATTANVLSNILCLILVPDGLKPLQMGNTINAKLFGLGPRAQNTAVLT